jgi:hypothetical protein
MLFGPDSIGGRVFLRTAAKCIGGTKSGKRDDADSNDQKRGFCRIGVASGDALDTCQRDSGSIGRLVFE